MRLNLFYILLFLAFVSCNKEKREVDNIAIARVNNSKLYKEDIKDLVPAGTSKKDSLIIVKDFIDRWASQKLLFNASEVNLSDDKQAELNKLVDEYKKDLYTKAYIEQLVYKSFDTIVNEQELSDYYEKNKNNFKTNEALVKMSFIQINKNSPKINAITNKFLSGSKENKDFLKNNAIDFKSYAFNDSIWIDMNQVYEKIPFINLENKQKYVSSGMNFQYPDSTTIWLVKINNVLPKDSATPLEFLKPTIKQIIINNRKLELINTLEKEITNDAIKDNKYEIYK